MTTTKARIEKGARIEATYLGTRFTGTVREHRGHTINYRVFLTFIDVDEPVHVTAIGRTEDKCLLVHTAWDGSALPSDAGDWGTDTITVLSEGGTV